MIYKINLIILKRIISILNPLPDVYIKTSGIAPLNIKTKNVSAEKIC